jgi:hypothetical protein
MPPLAHLALGYPPTSETLRRRSGGDLVTSFALRLEGSSIMPTNACRFFSHSNSPAFLKLAA